MTAKPPPRVARGTDFMQQSAGAQLCASSTYVFNQVSVTNIMSTALSAIKSLIATLISFVPTEQALKRDSSTVQSCVSRP